MKRAIPRAENRKNLDQRAILTKKAPLRNKCVALIIGEVSLASSIS
jgi:hypothetical protein